MKVSQEQINQFFLTDVANTPTVKDIQAELAKKHKPNADGEYDELYWAEYVDALEQLLQGARKSNLQQGSA